MEKEHKCCGCLLKRFPIINKYYIPAEDKNGKPILWIAGQKTYNVFQSKLKQLKMDGFDTDRYRVVIDQQPATIDKENIKND